MTMKPMKFASPGARPGSSVVASRARAGKSKDAELDSLLENLKDREEGTNQRRKRRPSRRCPAAGEISDRRIRLRPRNRAERGRARSKHGQVGSAARAADQARGQITGTGGLAPKDQAIDDLLGKLGETKDEPTAEERPRNQERCRPPPASGNLAKRVRKLGGKDKEIDERLEEIAGRKRKRPHADEEERSGPVGEMIKEMRDVEQRLGKPDPSEDTQAKQKQIIKRIDKLIEQVRQSGSSAGKLTMRRRQQQGNQQGQQQGDQTGAMAQGAGR